MTSDLDDFLMHHGILGMHWGIRKSENGSSSKTKKSKPKPEIVYSKKLKNGGSLIVTKNPNEGSSTRLGDFLAKKHPDLFIPIDQVHSFTLRNAEGKRVGDASFAENPEKPGELYLDWITVNKKDRGQGYASATMKAMVNYSQANNIHTLKLEVPGNAPDAKHIYESLGFKSTSKEIVKDLVWNGLEEMELKVPQTQLTHTIDIKSLGDYLVEAINDANLDDSGEPLKDKPVSNFLAHYGIYK